MSTQITMAFVNQYKNNVQLLSQQKPSKFEAAVRVESIKGERAYYEQIGAVEAQLAGGRHSDTPLMNTPHLRRAVDSKSYDWADMVDDFDKVRMLIDPTSAYATNAVYAFNRQKDKAIIEAALGTSMTGHAGEVPVPFPAAQTIAAGGPLTIDVLLATRKLLKDADVDESIPLYFALGPKQEEDLLKTTAVTSADYNTVRALVQGDINTFCGFNFIRSTLLPLDGTDRTCIAWAKDGLLLAKGMDIRTRISERDDKRYSTQVYVSMDLGATRMEEVKVIKITASEA